MPTANQVGALIRQGAADYAGLVDQANRTSVRARVLHLIDQLQLDRNERVTTRRVTADEVRADAALRGAIVIHLDLVFRSSVTPVEVVHTATRGIVRVAFHPRLDGVPVGVVLAAPTRRLARHRTELFEVDGPELGESEVVMPYALAASPRRLGAGALLLREIVADCAALDPHPRVVTFSPLTGMRARVIRLLDDPTAWRDSLGELREEAALRDQLLTLLEQDALPDAIGEPARTWLTADFPRFANSPDYAVGNFHRSMGAHFIGLSDRADPNDSDALWARAYFDYGDGLALLNSGGA